MPTRVRLVPKPSTLDDLEWPHGTLLQKRCVFGAQCTNLNESRPTLSAAQMYRLMTRVYGNIRCVRIFAGVPLSGASNDCRVVDDGILGGFEWQLLRNFRYKASNIIWLYATPCRPVIDCKMNDLE